MAEVIAWVQANLALVVGLLVALIDLVFALVPTWQSNGILDWVYKFLKGLVAPKPPAA